MPVLEQTDGFLVCIDSLGAVFLQDGLFHVQTNLKYADPSCKMDLGLKLVLEEKAHFIAK